MTARYKPNVTVATVIQSDDRFLMVEELRSSDSVRVINQPAGHLEAGESLLEAALREVAEETCWRAELTAYLGPTLLTGDNGIDYLRHSFLARPIALDESLHRDDSILDVHWLTRGEILSGNWILRHPVVADLIDQDLLDAAVPLTIVRHS